MTKAMRTIGRLAAALAVALMIGTLLTGGVDAKPKAPMKASIAERVRAQRDMCELIGGGTMTATETAFGSTITECTGGTQDGTKCVNTKYSTNCTQTRSAPAGATHGEAVSTDAVIAADPGTAASDSGPRAVQATVVASDDQP